jgi:hypothetical protein
MSAPPNRPAAGPAPGRRLPRASPRVRELTARVIGERDTREKRYWRTLVGLLRDPAAGCAAWPAGR